MLLKVLVVSAADADVGYITQGINNVQASRKDLAVTMQLKNPLTRPTHEPVRSTDFSRNKYDPLRLIPPKGGTPNAFPCKRTSQLRWKFMGSLHSFWRALGP